MKNTVLTFKEAKQKGEKLTMLTAYDYSTAKLVDEAGKAVDAVRVNAGEGGIGKEGGDRLGGVLPEFAREQHALEFGLECVVGELHGGIPLRFMNGKRAL